MGSRGDTLDSVSECNFKGFRQQSNPKVRLLARVDSRVFWQEGVVLHQRREEEEELGPGQGLAQTLPPAQGEWDPALVLDNSALAVQEPLGPELVL